MRYCLWGHRRGYEQLKLRGVLWGFDPKDIAYAVMTWRSGS